MDSPGHAPRFQTAFRDHARRVALVAIATVAALACNLGPDGNTGFLSGNPEATDAPDTTSESSSASVTTTTPQTTSTDASSSSDASATTETSGTGIDTGGTDTDSGEVTGVDSESDTGAVCGDGEAGIGEDCDGDDFKGEDCESQGLSGGVLTCGDDCLFDYSGCLDLGLCSSADEPPGGVCPEECNAGCDMATGTCNIECDALSCYQSTVDCPDGWACEVTCEGATACDSATVNCNASYACTVMCDGNVACEDAVFNCGDGPCTVFCTGNTPCEGAEFNCGLSNSTLKCVDVNSVNPVPTSTPAMGSTCGCGVSNCE